MNASQATLIETSHSGWPAQGQWPSQGQWTYDDYRRLPDDGWRYEVIRGRLFKAPAPRPRHQKTLGRLHLAFSRFVDARDLGELYLAPIDVILPGLAMPVQPDLSFIRKDRLAIVTDDGVEGAPDLVVEVLSPSNWLADRRVKLELYAAAGVEEYWIVDPDEGTIEVFVLDRGSYALLDKRGLGESIRSRLLDGFEVALDEVVPGG